MVHNRSIRISSIAAANMSPFETARPLIHLMIPFFLHTVGTVVAWPAVADAVVNALCTTDKCSEALFLSGAQHVVRTPCAQLPAPIKSFNPFSLQERALHVPHISPTKSS